MHESGAQHRDLGLGGVDEGAEDGLHLRGDVHHDGLHEPAHELAHVHLQIGDPEGVGIRGVAGAGVPTGGDVVELEVETPLQGREVLARRARVHARVEEQVRLGAGVETDLGAEQAGEDLLPGEAPGGRHEAEAHVALVHAAVAAVGDEAPAQEPELHVDGVGQRDLGTHAEQRRRRGARLQRVELEVEAVLHVDAEREVRLPLQAGGAGALPDRTDGETGEAEVERGRLHGGEVRTHLEADADVEELAERVRVGAGSRRRGGGLFAEEGELDVAGRVRRRPRRVNVAQHARAVGVREEAETGEAPGKLVGGGAEHVHEDVLHAPPDLADGEVPHHEGEEQGLEPDELGLEVVDEAHELAEVAPDERDGLLVVGGGVVADEVEELREAVHEVHVQEPVREVREDVLGEVERGVVVAVGRLHAGGVAAHEAVYEGREVVHAEAGDAELLAVHADGYVPADVALAHEDVRRVRAPRGERPAHVRRPLGGPQVGGDPAQEVAQGELRALVRAGVAHVHAETAPQRVVPVGPRSGSAVVADVDFEGAHLGAEVDLAGEAELPAEVRVPVHEEGGPAPTGEVDDAAEVETEAVPGPQAGGAAGLHERHARGGAGLVLAQEAPEAEVDGQRVVLASRPVVGGAKVEVEVELDAAVVGEAQAQGVVVAAEEDELGGVEDVLEILHGRDRRVGRSHDLLVLHDGDVGVHDEVVGAGDVELEGLRAGRPRGGERRGVAKVLATVHGPGHGRGRDPAHHGPALHRVADPGVHELRRATHQGRRRPLLPTAEDTRFPAGHVEEGQPGAGGAHVVEGGGDLQAQHGDLGVGPGLLQLRVDGVQEALQDGAHDGEEAGAERSQGAHVHAHLEAGPVRVQAVAVGEDVVPVEGDVEADEAAAHGHEAGLDAGAPTHRERAGCPHDVAHVPDEVRERDRVRDRGLEVAGVVVEDPDAAGVHLAGVEVDLHGGPAAAVDLEHGLVGGEAVDAGAEEAELGLPVEVDLALQGGDLELGGVRGDPHEEAVELARGGPGLAGGPVREADVGEVAHEEHPEGEVEAGAAHVDLHAGVGTQVQRVHLEAGLEVVAEGHVGFGGRRVVLEMQREREAGAHGVVVEGRQEPERVEVLEAVHEVAHRGDAGRGGVTGGRGGTGAPGGRRPARPVHTHLRVAVAGEVARHDHEPGGVGPRSVRRHDAHDRPERRVDVGGDALHRHRVGAELRVGGRGLQLAVDDTSGRVRPPPARGQRGLLAAAQDAVALAGREVAHVARELGDVAHTDVREGELQVAALQGLGEALQELVQHEQEAVGVEAQEVPQVPEVDRHVLEDLLQRLRRVRDGGGPEMEVAAEVRDVEAQSGVPAAEMSVAHVGAQGELEVHVSYVDVVAVRVDAAGVDEVEAHEVEEARRRRGAVELPGVHGAVGTERDPEGHGEGRVARVGDVGDAERDAALGVQGFQAGEEHQARGTGVHREGGVGGADGTVLQGERPGEAHLEVDARAQRLLARQHGDRDADGQADGLRDAESEVDVDDLRVHGVAAHDRRRRPAPGGYGQAVQAVGRAVAVGAVDLVEGLGDLVEAGYEGPAGEDEPGRHGGERRGHVLDELAGVQRGEVRPEVLQPADLREVPEQAHDLAEDHEHEALAEVLARKHVDVARSPAQHRRRGRVADGGGVDLEVVEDVPRGAHADVVEPPGEGEHLETAPHEAETPGGGLHAVVAPVVQHVAAEGLHDEADRVDARPRVAEAHEADVEVEEPRAQVHDGEARLEGARRRVRTRELRGPRDREGSGGVEHEDGDARRARGRRPGGVRDREPGREQAALAVDVLRGRRRGRLVDAAVAVEVPAVLHRGPCGRGGVEGHREGHLAHRRAHREGGLRSGGLGAGRAGDHGPERGGGAGGQEPEAQAQAQSPGAWRPHGAPTAVPGTASPAPPPGTGSSTGRSPGGRPLREWTLRRRMARTSRSMRRPSGPVRIVLSSRWPQATPISLTSIPATFARWRSSMSKANPCVRSGQNSRWAAARVNAFRPHCVSRTPESPRARTATLKERAQARRPRGWGCKISLSSCARLAMTTSAPVARRCRAARSTSATSVERSASVKATTSPAAASAPARTAAPLP